MQNLFNLKFCPKKLKHFLNLFFSTPPPLPVQPNQTQSPLPNTPTGSSPTPSSSSSYSTSEPRLNSTTSWLLQNFTPDMTTALPKEEVYDFYIKTFTNSKPISTADFGKLMRQVFPEVKARRLGQRGASKYCYANIRKKSEYDLEKPQLPEIKIPSLKSDYLSWGKQNFQIDFTSLSQLLTYLKSNNLKPLNLRKRRASSVSSKKSKEDLEIKKYFTDSNQWPQLRNLLSNNEFLPISNKKRHCSNNVEFIKPSNNEVSKTELYFRSASVPIFDRFLLNSSSADSGYDSVNSNTPILENVHNPLLSSVGMNLIEEQIADLDEEVNHATGEDIFDSVFDLINSTNEANNNKIFDY